MLLLVFVIALVFALPNITGLAKLPEELLLPIVSNIDSYQDLDALNMSSKAFYPSILPIFDFTTACQVLDVWPNAKLQIRSDFVLLILCATHIFIKWF